MRGWNEVISHILGAWLFLRGWNEVIDRGLGVERRWTGLIFDVIVNT